MRQIYYVQARWGGNKFETRRRYRGLEGAQSALQAAERDGQNPIVSTRGQRLHRCPGHEGAWSCTTPEECRAPYEMLCDDCDTELVRRRLGGKWIE